MFCQGCVGHGLCGRVQAGVAAHAATVAAEAVHVGLVGMVRRHSPDLRVKRVPVIDVIVISISVERKRSIVYTIIYKFDKSR